jgi:hypothetical protein
VSVVVVDSHAVGRADQDNCGSERIAGLSARQFEQGLPSEARCISYFQLLVASRDNGHLCDLPDFGFSHVEQLRDPGAGLDPLPEQQCAEICLPEAACLCDAGDDIVQRLVVLRALRCAILLQRCRDCTAALGQELYYGAE